MNSNEMKKSIAQVRNIPERFSEEWFENLFAGMHHTATRLESEPQSENDMYGTDSVLLQRLTNEDGGGWLASAPALPGCTARGDNEAGAVLALITAAGDWENPGRGFPWSLNAPLALWRKQQGLIGKMDSPPRKGGNRFNGPAIKRGREAFLAGWQKAFENGYDGDREDIERRAGENYHFSSLTDAEWAVVLKEINAANPKPFCEMSIRRYVNWAGSGCGLFAHGGELDGRLDKRHFTKRISNCRELAVAIESLLPPLVRFIADLDEDDQGDRHFRDLDFRLMELLLKVQSDQLVLERRKAHAPLPPANRSTPKQLERWLAGLVRVWEEKLGLPLNQQRKLGNFIRKCVEPYRIGIDTEKQTKDFITKLKTGKVRKGDPSMMESLQDRRTRNQFF